MDGEAGRLIEHQEFSVFEKDIDSMRFDCGSRGAGALRFEGNEKLDAISGVNHIVGFGSSTVEAYAVLAKQFAYVTDGEIPREKILDFLAALTLGDDDLSHRL
jgi:hypothetical protein